MSAMYVVRPRMLRNDPTRERGITKRGDLRIAFTLTIINAADGVLLKNLEKYKTKVANLCVN